MEELQEVAIQRKMPRRPLTRSAHVEEVLSLMSHHSKIRNFEISLFSFFFHYEGRVQ